MKPNEVINGIRITDHLGLVHRTARKFKGYCKCGLEYMDLVQAGSVGLYVGATKFDASLGYKPSTYLSWWIFHHIVREIENNGRTVRLPVHVHTEARDRGESLPAHAFSLNAIVSKHGAEDMREFIDFLGADETSTTALEQHQAAAHVDRLLNELDPRAREVMRGVYYDDRTRAELGRQLGALSRERVRQIVNKSLEDMRQADRRLGGAGQALAGEMA